MAITYFFPFDKVEKGSKIVLYGAGVCGRALYEQCTVINYCDVILWADVRWQQLNIEYNEYSINSVQDISMIKDRIDYVIIAIVDKKMAEDAKTTILRAGVPADKIMHFVNVIDEDYYGKQYISQDRFLNSQIKQILPYDYIDKVNGYRKNRVGLGLKKKIRFAVSALNNIIGLQSIAEAFYEDERYDVLLVVYGNPKGVKAEMDRLRLPYSYLYDYSIIEDCPDVFFVTYGGGEEYRNMKQYTKYVIALHISIVKWSDIPISQYLEQVEMQFNMAQPDIYIWDKLLFNEMKSKDLLKDNFQLIGNPKFDVIYNCTRNKTIGDAWGKLKGKKVFLWCTDHVYFCDNITFDLFAKKLISLASDNPEMALIFRPHPQFVDELVENRIWSVDDLYYFKSYLEQSDNMIWDTNGTYEMAYGCCDAILVDSECGIVCSALPLGVPIGALLREDKEKSAQQDIVDNLYSIRSAEDLDDFVNMVMDGCDPMKEIRLAMVDKYINHFDGKNGVRIKEFVEEIIK